jgi:hypothetical protein
MLVGDGERCTLEALAQRSSPLIRWDRRWELDALGHPGEIVGRAHQLLDRAVVAAVDKHDDVLVSRVDVDEVVDEADAIGIVDRSL